MVLMKGRLIGVLWIVGALALFYFAFDGAYFYVLFVFALMMCEAEVMSVILLQPCRVKTDVCGPAGACIAQPYIACFAAFASMILTKEQILFVVITCSLSDTGAFVIGKLFGKHKAKFTEKTSPNKTIEGYIGGIICTAAAFFFCPVLGIEITPGIVAFLAFAGIVAEIGDLFGSATKRQLGIKDSGDFISKAPVFRILEFPLRGHGGYLDRLDSISLALLLFALLNMPQF